MTKSAHYNLTLRLSLAPRSAHVQKTARYSYRQDVRKMRWQMVSGSHSTRTEQLADALVYGTAPSATPTSAPRRSSEFAMNATSVPMVEDVLSADHLASQTHRIARSARGLKRTATVVLRSSTSERRERTCSMVGGANYAKMAR